MVPALRGDQWKGLRWGFEVLGDCRILIVINLIYYQIGEPALPPLLHFMYEGTVRHPFHASYVRLPPLLLVYSVDSIHGYVGRICLGKIVARKCASSRFFSKSILKLSFLTST